MSHSGAVKSFNDAKGWGFVTSDAADGDIFLHVKDCGEGRPVVGDWLTFDLEDDAVRGGQLKAINVSGCTGVKGGGKGGGGGNGAKGPRGGRSCEGKVKSFNDKKGWGFIEFQGEDVFLHVKDCDGRPNVGDWVSFDMEPDQVRGGQNKALKVIGCTGVDAGKGGCGGGGCGGGGCGMKGGCVPMLYDPYSGTMMVDPYGGCYGAPMGYGAPMMVPYGAPMMVPKGKGASYGAAKGAPCYGCAGPYGKGMKR
mmetsp:Transcript_39563/g.62847  ORF Transcript_39563/g.62847 Transcript_39563/m.62847 type:complete len:252 (+) Transcript_39563:68-823(+)